MVTKSEITNFTLSEDEVPKSEIFPNEINLVGNPGRNMLLGAIRSFHQQFPGNLIGNKNSSVG
jgi:hypothetical protein